MVARVLLSLLTLTVLLGLDGLMQTLGVAAAEHETAGELVHDDDLAVLHHVVHVPLHDAVGLDGLVDVVGSGGCSRGQLRLSRWKNSSAFLMPRAVRVAGAGPSRPRCSRRRC